LFEIFHLIYIKEDSEADLLYKNNTEKETKAMYAANTEKINIGAFWNGKNFIPKEGEDLIDLSEDKETYVYLGNNEVFATMRIPIVDPAIEKYRAAMSENVIIVNFSSDKVVHLGDLWDNKNKVVIGEE